MTEDVRAVQPMFRDIQFQQVRQRARLIGEQLRRQVVLDEQLLMPLDRAVGTRDPRFDVECELDSGMQHVSVGRFLDRPVNVTCPV